MSTSRLPTIARRLLWVTAVGSLLIALAVTASAGLTVDAEVDELLDDVLQASAAQLAPLLLQSGAAPHTPPPDPEGEVRFAWAWYDSAGRTVRASPGAEPAAWQGAGSGFADRAHWRLYGLPLRGELGLLVVAQTRAERSEARREVISHALLAAMALTLLGLPLLAWRAQQELQPLQRLGERLASFDADRADPRGLPAALGAAQRGELLPVHEALATIAQRLGERLDFEREFSAQAAHLLRTPLAGMDAQLAVALREQPQQLRLQRVRQANQRLQHLVVALLRLFRPEPELRRKPVEVRSLLAGLPLGDLQLDAGPPCLLDADAELLAAALLNLVDNAQRHGATRLSLTAIPGGLRLADNGQGLAPEQLEALRASLQPNQQAPGLGLRLALLVASAHGGRIEIARVEPGFAIELHLMA
ncbi:MAG: sensor histidine kinase [Roseateles sp.]|uniref:sensor histidine kinase n=1 Tax=Roseateles sp. TaxID=1971397 RepID=UPI004035CDB1